MKIWLLIALLLLSGSAEAAKTGNELYDEMNSADLGTRRRAFEYVSGVYEASQLYRAMDLTDPARQSAVHICLPDGVTYGQMQDVVRLYLGAYPEHRHEPAAPQIIAALLVNFHCTTAETNALIKKSK